MSPLRIVGPETAGVCGPGPPRDGPDRADRGRAAPGWIPCLSPPREPRGPPRGAWNSTTTARRNDCSFVIRQPDPAPSTGLAPGPIGLRVLLARPEAVAP